MLCNFSTLRLVLWSCAGNTGSRNGFLGLLRSSHLSIHDATGSFCHLHLVRVAGAQKVAQGRVYQLGHIERYVFWRLLFHGSFRLSPVHPHHLLTSVRGALNSEGNVGLYSLNFCRRKILEEF